MSLGENAIKEKSADATEDVSKLVGWSKKDKLLLLKSLKKYGSNGIENITKAVSVKTSQEIKEALNYYKLKVAECPTIKNKKIPLKSRKPKNIQQMKDMSPLAAWAKILIDKIEYTHLVGEIPEALRLIAEHESLPKPECTGNVNFSELYRVLADAMEGKPVELNEQQKILIHKCLVETALCTKELEEIVEIDQILNEINISRQDSHIHPNISQGDKIDIFGDIISQRTYNPLTIPEEYLRVDDDSEGAEDSSSVALSNLNDSTYSESETTNINIDISSRSDSEDI